MPPTSQIALVAALCAAVGAPASVRAADPGYGRHHHRHHIVREEAPILVPQGYAYGGYGPGPGPGWVEGRGLGFGPGYAPGYGYIPPGYPDAGFDLGR